MDTKRTLGLDLPARSAAARSTFLANPKEVEIWISNLPITNLGETTRQVFKTLSEFNRQEIPNNTRLRVAEMFQQPIEYIATNLRKYYFDIPLPLSAKNRKIATLNRKLQSELAISYQIVVDGIVAGRPGIFERKTLVTGIVRTMQALLAVMYQSVLVYNAYPRGIWRVIHRLYAYSEHNNLGGIQVKTGKKKYSSSKSINDIYKQLLIFAVSSPLSYRQSDIQQIHNALPRWSPLVRLSLNDHTQSDSSGLFISQLRTDSSPIHLELQAKDNTSPYILLNTRALVQHLQEHFDTDQNKDTDYSQTGIRPISKALLRKLIHEFNAAPHRKFSRTRLNFELQVAASLSALHTLLTAPSKTEKVRVQQPYNTPDWINSEFRNTGINPPRFVFSEQNLTLSDYDEPMQQKPCLAGHTSRTASKEAQPPGWARQESEIEPFICRTINESAGGYCIDWEADSAPKIKIGELIGIRSVSERYQYSIGMVRWMQKSAGNNLHIGIEILSPSSSAVLIRRTSKEYRSEQAHKAILLPELTTSGQPTSLIVPSIPFNLGDIIWMEEGTIKQQIRLTRMLETTGAFAQFQFVPLVTENELSDDLDEDTDFESIWSTL